MKLSQISKICPNCNRRLSEWSSLNYKWLNDSLCKHVHYMASTDDDVMFFRFRLSIGDEEYIVASNNSEKSIKIFIAKSFPKDVSTRFLIKEQCIDDWLDYDAVKQKLSKLLILK